MPLDYQGLDTLSLLDELEAEVLRLRSKTERLSLALEKVAPKKRSRTRTKSQAVQRAEAQEALPATLPPVKAPATRKRRALGRGLAEIRNRNDRPAPAGPTE